MTATDARLIVNSNLPRPAEADLAALRGAPTSVLADASRQVRSFGHPLRPFSRGRWFIGPALTVGVGSLAQWKALDMAQPGDVLIIAGGERRDQAEFGGVYVALAEAKGIAAIVTDGLLRDAEDIRTRSLPVFACGTHPSSPADPIVGTVGQGITVFGTVVEPGDLVVGDDDGIVILPRADLGGILERLPRQAEKEEALRLTATGQLPDALRRGLEAIPTRLVG